MCRSRPSPRIAHVSQAGPYISQQLTAEHMQCAIFFAELILLFSKQQQICCIHASWSYGRNVCWRCCTKVQCQLVVCCSKRIEKTADFLIPVQNYSERTDIRIAYLRKIPAKNRKPICCKNYNIMLKQREKKTKYPIRLLVAIGDCLFQPIGFCHQV